MEHVEVLRDLSEVCRAAIKAGDWKVDGACDPDSDLEYARHTLRRNGWRPNSIDGSWMEARNG